MRGRYPGKILSSGDITAHTGKAGNIDALCERSFQQRRCHLPGWANVGYVYETPDSTVQDPGPMGSHIRRSLYKNYELCMLGALSEQLSQFTT